MDSGLFVQASSPTKSPVVDQQGNVTFYASHDGNELYLVGSFNEWDIANAVQMEKEGELFTKRLSLSPGTYEYKFAKGTSWDQGDFTDPLNPLMSPDGNSVVHVPGIAMDKIPSTVSLDRDIILEGYFINDKGEKLEVTPSWSLVDGVRGVELKGDVLSIGTNAEIGTTFFIQAEYDGYQSKKAITIVEEINEFTIHYYRYDGKAMEWDLWIYGEDLEGNAYAFNDFDGTYAKGTYYFYQDEITVITRPGNWETQEMDRVISIPEGKNKVEVWMIQGDENVYYNEPEIDDESYKPPTVRFIYEREKKDYDDWNLWVWNTGAKDGQIDFDEMNDFAIANIEVAPNTPTIGFKVRKGDDWEIVDVDVDREIRVSPTERLTKVYVKEGVYEFFTVPFASAPEIERGNVTFYYRDQELYWQDEMDTIDRVQLHFNGKLYDMTYEDRNERFMVTIDQVMDGTYEYTFRVTKDGETVEVSDPYNLNEDGRSFIQLSTITPNIKTEIYPQSIDYNQNAVLSLEITDRSSDEQISDLIREISVDLSELGGHEKTMIDPELNALTIGVNDRVSAGKKSLPIAVTDIYGGIHETEAEIYIKPREIKDEHDFDWDEARIYFMLTDRFADGNEANNIYPGYDPTKPGHYHGGDFKGITQNLDYLHDLGINTIWITPIVENIYHDVAFNDENAGGNAYHSYHGYWALDFEKLNPHLGTLEEFHELIDAASDRGIKIMVDVVLNHVGYGLKLKDGEIENPPPHYPTDEDRERFKDMLRQDGGTGGEVTGELAGLPDLITEDPRVRKQIVDWQVSWLEKATTKKGNTIDYFRVDTVKHVEDTTWMHFKNELTKIKPEFKLIGEAWGAGANNHYAKKYLNTGMMDSLLDFEFKTIARNLVNGKIDQVNRDIATRTESITNTAMLGQFLGSHDEDGFLHFVGDPNDTSKLKIAATLQITSKGQPVIYYGEELGLSGLNNWPIYNNRYDFPWNEVENNDVLQHYQKLLNIRKNYSKVLSKGSYQFLEGNDDLGYMIFERNYEDQTVIVGINTTNNPIDLSLQVPFEEESELIDAYGEQRKTVENGRVSITLPSRSEGGTFIFVPFDESSSNGEEPVDEEDPPKESTKPDDKVGENLPKGEGTIKGDSENDPSSIEDTDNGKGKTLPNTSTNNVQMLMVGIFIFLSGMTLYYIRRRKA